ncbi:hypothetical protein HPP92_016734 [Vanilla planifolia]|uniref:Nucleobase-ascorbate transporter 6 n=1 Tax=Vanilla planifolia TaxID=51239 RepID=A0A835QPA7_VANPL|nr:hypothetical protein HPP92_016734 [Vanilla planifolia]
MAGGGGGGAAPAPKADELVPHPVKDQLPNVSYCITSPPPWREFIGLLFLFCSMVFVDIFTCFNEFALEEKVSWRSSTLCSSLGGGHSSWFQHYLVMLGTTVIIPTALVPQMGGGNDEKARVIQTLLFVAESDVLLAFIEQKFLHIMRGTQGALIVASTLQIIVGLSGLWRNVTRFLSPLSAVPLVALSGFGLYELGFPAVAKCVEIGLPMIIILIVISQYIPHAIHAEKPVFDRFAVIFSVAIVWLYAYFLTIGGAYKHSPPKTQLHCRTDRSGLVGSAPWIRVPYPFQWEHQPLMLEKPFAMMAAAFVGVVESTGTFIAVSRYASATPLPPSVLSRGIGWQGIGILLDGLFGTASGSTVSVENAGLLALTRVGSRRVVQISAGFMIFFSILGKFGAVLLLFQHQYLQLCTVFFFAYVGSVGLSFLQFCNLNSFRTKFILGFSIFMGLSVPQYFNEYTSVAGYGPAHTNARWFNDIVNILFSSEPFVAGVVAFFLDNTLQRRNSAVRKDRGYHWWDKFRSFKTDTRSEEFYSLPFNLNKFFPSV